MAEYLPAAEDNGPGIITYSIEVDPGVIWEQNMGHYQIHSHWYNCYESWLYQCQTQELALLLCGDN